MSIGLATGRAITSLSGVDILAVVVEEFVLLCCNHLREHVQRALPAQTDTRIQHAGRGQYKTVHTIHERKMTKFLHRK